MDTVEQSAAAWPPAGWVSNREAARMLGVGLETLTCGAWKWYASLRGQGKCVRNPLTGGRCNIYPIDVIRRIQAAQAEAAVPVIPEGFVDKDGACRMFGVTPFVWKKWINQGKVRFGHVIPSPVGARIKLYAVADLERLKEELFGQDKLYKDGNQGWHVPAGYVRREEAWERFGVSISIWQRWEREGTITCGERIGQGPKLYKVEDIERLLDEYGKYCPPYPDPERPGVYRVPLSGRDIKRREALVDAESLPLIEGGSCSWGIAADGVGFVAMNCADFAKGTPLRRVIMDLTDSPLIVRHVNGDPLDCRRQNLVVRTVSQRSFNMRKIRAVNGLRCTSRFKGVHWNRSRNRWIARICLNRKTIQLGRFHDEIAAAEAYDEAARELFGEHARLNFPDGVDVFLAAAKEDAPRADFGERGRAAA